MKKLKIFLVRWEVCCPPKSRSLGELNMYYVPRKFLKDGPHEHIHVSVFLELAKSMSFCWPFSRPGASLERVSYNVISIFSSFLHFCPRFIYMFYPAGSIFEPFPTILTFFCLGHRLMDLMNNTSDFFLGMLVSHNDSILNTARGKRCWFAYTKASLRKSAWIDFLLR